MNNAPQSSKLDDLLDKLKEEFFDMVGSEARDYEDYPTRLINEAHAEILALIEEVIGEDEPYDMNNHATINARNFLRASQRLRKDAL